MPEKKQNIFSQTGGLMVSYRRYKVKHHLKKIKYLSCHLFGFLICNNRSEGQQNTKHFEVEARLDCPQIFPLILTHFHPNAFIKLQQIALSPNVLMTIPGKTWKKLSATINILSRQNPSEWINCSTSACRCQSGNLVTLIQAICSTSFQEEKNDPKAISVEHPCGVSVVFLFVASGNKMVFPPWFGRGIFFGGKMLVVFLCQRWIGSQKVRKLGRNPP